MPATPSGRGRPKGSSNSKGSKSKSKASASFASDSDKKSQTFDNQSIIDTQSVQSALQSSNEQVIICILIRSSKIIKLAKKDDEKRNRAKNANCE